MSMSTENGRIRHVGEYDDAAYWERVKRNLAWMGNTEEEQRANQERLRDATIGIAGTGGIGGATAMRLVRMGARHIKIADPEDFELSNVQRQAGASVDTVDEEPPSTPILKQVNKAKEQAETDAILVALQSTRWNRKQAAQILNIDYKALLYKMKKLSIEN